MSSIAINANGFTLTHAALNATQGISPIERLILATLGSFANFLSECWPSNQTIADRTGLHERTVGKAIGKLQEKGLIERESRGQGRAMLTRILIPLTPPAHGLPPPAHGLPEPNRNLLQTPIQAATPEPQHQHTSIAVSPPLFLDIEQPEQPFPAIPDIEQPSISTNEALYKPVERSNEADPAIPTLETVTPALAPAIEADPLAEVPATLLADLGEVRKAKKRAPKPTKTEAKLWWQEAQKCGWDMQTVITTMILHGWARFNADWVQHVPPQAQPGQTQVWQPTPHTPASASTLAAIKEKIRQMKERWAASELAQTAPPPMRQ